MSKRRVPEEVKFLKQSNSPLLEQVERRTVTSGPLASYIVYKFDALVHNISFLFRCHLIRRFVSISMEGDFGAGLNNCFRLLGEGLNRMTRNTPLPRSKIMSQLDVYRRLSRDRYNIEYLHLP